MSYPMQSESAALTSFSVPRSDALPSVAAPCRNMYAECQSIVVNAAVAEVYHRWPRFEDLPKFVTALRNVERIDDTHFAFTSSLDGRDQEYVLRVVLRIPERRIAWHAVSETFSIGVALFEPLSSQRTQVTVKIRSAIDPSRLGESLRECLSNFKRVVEQPGAR